jgi:hypothetical protein
VSALTPLKLRALSAQLSSKSALGKELNQVADEMEAMQDDALRYRRLRILGAAPGESKQLEQGTVLRFQSLDMYIDEDINHYPSRGEAK